MSADPVATAADRVAALEAEVHGIYFCNTLYWKQGPAAKVAARTEYRRRLDRLEEIRCELAQLRLTQKRSGRVNSNF
jgi:hypothetical protein